MTSSTKPEVHDVSQCLQEDRASNGGSCPEICPPRPGVFSTKYPFYSAPRTKAEYGDERVCFCISLRAYLPNYTPNQYQIFFPAYVTFCRGSVLLWRRCDILCTSSFMTDDITGHTEARRSMTQRVTSLHRRAQENASAASYWLRRVQDSERRDCDVRRDLRARGTGGEACNAPLPSGSDSLYWDMPLDSTFRLLSTQTSAIREHYEQATLLIRNRFFASELNEC